MTAKSVAKSSRRAGIRPSSPSHSRAAPDIVSAIEREIVGGEIRGNQRLDERDLATRFGVSRTPIREALNRLVTSGLVEYRPNQGMFVAPMTLAQFFEMYETMTCLEGLCAQLCARRMDLPARTELAKFQKAGDEIVTKGDVAAYGRYNFAFHDRLYKGTQNHFLENQIRSLRRRLQPYRAYTFQLPMRIQESHAEHERIVKVIVSSDADAAEREMRRHMDIHRANFSDYVLLLSQALTPG